MALGEKISVVIDVVTDKARSALTSFKTAVGDANGVTGKFKAGVGSLGATLASFGPAGAAVAGGAMVAFGAHVLDAGTKLDAMDQKAKTVFGGSLGDVQAWADQNAAALGLTATEAIGAGAAIADLLKPMGFTTAEATGMTVKLLDLSGALSAWSGGTKTAAEVSQTFTKAMLGERDELKGLGISITEAEVSAGLLAKGQNKLTGASLAQAKALVTQQLIMDKSTDAQKAWADGSMDSQKRANEMKAAMAQLEETIIRELYPAVVKLTPTITALGKAAGVAAQSVSVLFDALHDIALDASVSGTEMADLAKQVESLGPAFYESSFAAKNGIKDFSDLWAMLRVGELTIDETKAAIAEWSASTKNLAGTFDNVAYGEMITAKNAALLKREADKLTTSTEQLNAQFDQLFGTLDQQEAWDRIKQDIAEIADGEGDTAQETRNLTRDMANLIKTAESIPAEKKISLLASLRAGDLATVKGYLDKWAKGVIIPITFSYPEGRPVMTPGGSGPDGARRTTTAPTSNTRSATTINITTAADPRAVVEAVNKYVRQGGRLGT